MPSNPQYVPSVTTKDGTRARVTNRPTSEPTKAPKTVAHKKLSQPGKPSNTKSHAANMPAQESMLSTPRSIIPISMTKASPQESTMRKLELVRRDFSLPSVKNDDEAIFDAMTATTKNATGRRTLPGLPASKRPRRRHCNDCLGARTAVAITVASPRGGPANSLQPAGPSLPQPPRPPNIKCTRLATESPLLGTTQ